jgi:hypothetical protein
MVEDASEGSLVPNYKKLRYSSPKRGVPRRMRVVRRAIHSLNGMAILGGGDEMVKSWSAK